MSVPVTEILDVSETDNDDKDSDCDNEVIVMAIE